MRKYEQSAPLSQPGMLERSSSVFMAGMTVRLVCGTMRRIIRVSRVGCGIMERYELRVLLPDASDEIIICDADGKHPTTGAVVVRDLFDRNHDRVRLCRTLKAQKRIWNARMWQTFMPHVSAWWYRHMRSYDRRKAA